MREPDYTRYEAERLLYLHALGILDTPREDFFDFIVRRAARKFQVASAIITFVDAQRVWMKASYGCSPQELKRTQAICAYTILQQDIFEVCDTHRDPCFAYLPTVTGAPYHRFYAGCPLQAATKYNLGVLCLLDPHPRSLTEPEKEQLHQLAQTVDNELAARAEWRGLQ